MLHLAIWFSHLYQGHLGTGIAFYIFRLHGSHLTHPQSAAAKKQNKNPLITSSCGFWTARERFRSADICSSCRCSCTIREPNFWAFYSICSKPTSTSPSSSAFLLHVRTHVNLTRLPGTAVIGSCYFQDLDPTVLIYSMGKGGLFPLDLWGNAVSRTLSGI